MKEKLKLITFNNCKDLGLEVEKEIEKLSDEKNILINVKNVRFTNGEGKTVIDDFVRNKDLYILSDVGNYDCTYMLRGSVHHMSPDEHYEDVKRVISATNGRYEKITLIMPFLYESRQHRRKDGESLDCALSLQELEKLRVDAIITFDCHDPNVSNAIPNLPFENYYASDQFLEEIKKREKIDFNNVLVISPDIGAMERARYYAEKIGCDVGLFYKRRDLSKVVNGKNPIVEHTYLGQNPNGKDILVIDDMIASGGSMIDVATRLKERGASHIYLISTFGLFTEGTKVFDEGYKNKLFDKVYCTNLTYIPDTIKEKDWFEIVDCSKLIAKIIVGHHKGIEYNLLDEEDINPELNKKEEKY